MQYVRQRRYTDNTRFELELNKREVKKKKKRTRGGAGGEGRGNTRGKHTHGANKIERKRQKRDQLQHDVFLPLGKLALQHSMDTQSTSIGSHLPKRVLDEPLGTRDASACELFISLIYFKIAESTQKDELKMGKTNVI